MMGVSFNGGGIRGKGREDLGSLDKINEFNDLINR